MTHLEISLVKCIGYVNSIYSQMSLGFSNLIVLIYISRTEKMYVILNAEEKKKYLTHGVKNATISAVDKY